MGSLFLRKQHLERLLQSRGLGSSLPKTLSPAKEVLPTGIDKLDRLLAGGIPRGSISEITGPISSGKTTLLLSLLSQATQQGEIVACIDTNALDPFSATRKRIDLKNLLWVRCTQAEQVFKASDILCRAGNFGVIAADLHGFHLSCYGSTPWFRLQRAVEGTRTVFLVLAPRPVARNAARLSLRLRRTDLRWQGKQPLWKLLQGFSLETRLARRGTGSLQLQI